MIIAGTRGGQTCAARLLLAVQTTATREIGPRRMTDAALSLHRQSKVQIGDRAGRDRQAVQVHLVALRHETPHVERRHLSIATGMTLRSILTGLRDRTTRLEDETTATETTRRHAMIAVMIAVMTGATTAVMIGAMTGARNATTATGRHAMMTETDRRATSRVIEGTAGFRTAAAAAAAIATRVKRAVAVQTDGIATATVTAIVIGIENRTAGVGSIHAAATRLSRPREGTRNFGLRAQLGVRRVQTVGTGQG